MFDSKLPYKYWSQKLNWIAHTIYEIRIIVTYQKTCQLQIPIRGLILTEIWTLAEIQICDSLNCRWLLNAHQLGAEPREIRDALIHF